MEESNPKRQRFKISTSFVESKRGGKGAGYLNLGEIDPRTGVEIALGCVFAPLWDAIQGAQEDDVEESIAQSFTQLTHYTELARTRCKASTKRISDTRLPEKAAAVGEMTTGNEIDEEKRLN
jgi:hypothetical protein